MSNLRQRKGSGLKKLRLFFRKDENLEAESDTADSGASTPISVGDVYGLDGEDKRRVLDLDKKVREKINKLVVSL